MQIHYLEIVTPEVDMVCAAYAKMHGIAFTGADVNLGNARTAVLRVKWAILRSRITALKLAAGKNPEIR